MRYDILRKLSGGLHISGHIIRAVNIRRGRFREEYNALVILESDDSSKELFDLKVFTGRPPYYRPWVEIFNIRGSLGPNITSGFYAGGLEDAILDLMSEALEPGERLYVEYYSDWETTRALELGVPPAATRLGYKLFVRGFTYLRDWYFPEGFMEGGPKLQAEKPYPKREDELFGAILEELSLFIQRYKGLGKRSGVIARAIERAAELLKRHKVART